MGALKKNYAVIPTVANFLNHKKRGSAAVKLKKGKL